MANLVEPESPLLVDVIKDVLEGRADRARLEKALQAAKSGLQGQIQEFHQTLESVDGSIQDRCSSLLDAADNVFAVMQAALGQIEGFLKSGEQNLLFQAGSALTRGASQLNFIFTELTHFVMACQGPTDIPNLNLILRAYEFYNPEQDAKGERLQELVQLERLRTLETLDQLAAGPESEDFKALAEVYDEHLRTLNRTFFALEKAQPDAVKVEIDKLKTTFQRISERLMSAALVTRVSGPTKSQQVNLVLSLAEDVEAMKVGDGPLYESLAHLKQMASEQLAQLEQFRQAGSDSVLLREAIEEALEALEFQQEALADFDDFFEMRRQPMLRIAREKLLESTLEVEKALEHLGEVADREGKVACLRCSHYNPPGRSNCEKCSAPLPNLGHASQTSTFEAAEGPPAASENDDEPIMTSHLVRLYKAVDAVFAGQIDAAAFEAEIQHYQNIINNHSEYEIEEPIWENLDEEQRALAEESYKGLEEAQNVFAQGVGEMCQALDCFRSYLESEARQDLEEGVRLMNEGAKKVAAVRDVSKRANPS